MTTGWIRSIAHRLRAAVPGTLLLFCAYTFCGGTSGFAEWPAQDNHKIRVEGHAYGYPLDVFTWVTVKTPAPDVTPTELASHLRWLPPDSAERGRGPHMNIINLLLVAMCALLAATLLDWVFALMRG